MNTNKITLATLGALIFALVAIYIFTIAPKDALGGAFTGTAAQLKYATTTTVGPQAVARVTVFPQNGECKNRVITTSGNSAIMLSFGEPRTAGNLSSTTISGTAGFWQAASTTVAYDAEQFGCGLWTAYGYASTTLTVAEF